MDGRKWLSTSEKNELLSATFLGEDTAWRVRKNPVAGEAFFLTSTFIEPVGLFPRPAILQPALMNSFAPSVNVSYVAKRNQFRDS
jgi:hypothetical protein